MSETVKEKFFKQVVNYMLSFDGLIMDTDGAYLAERCIEKFIPKTRQHLFSVNANRYPARIEQRKEGGNN